MNINLARTLANIAHRATTLWEDGYTCQQWETWGDTFTVKNPDGASYVVVLSTEGSREHCTCEAFAQYKECKHLLAVKAEVKRTEAQGDALDAMTEEEYFGRW